MIPADEYERLESQEIIERDPSISDFTRLEVFSFDEEASMLKEHDGPDVASALVDHLPISKATGHFAWP